MKQNFETSQAPSPEDKCGKTTNDRLTKRVYNSGLYLTFLYFYVLGLCSKQYVMFNFSNLYEKSYPLEISMLIALFHTT